MHDQLRDLGRRIVKDLSLKRLHLSVESMTRLWDEEEIESFLEANEGSRILEGISLRKCSRLAALQSQSHQRLMQKMTVQRFYHLRLLDLVGCENKVVEFFLSKCGKELSWLCLDGVSGIVMPHAIEALGFCTGLRVLQMRDSCMEELPTAVGNLVHLLELDLTDCSRLQNLPREIGHLKRLKRFQLHGCRRLREVPSGVSQLIDLEYLSLSRCSSLVRMVEFETPMDHLYELDLWWCVGLQFPFKSLGKLHRLRTLNMLGCGSLVIENPFESFRQLSRLEKLNLRHCSRLIPRFCLEHSTCKVTQTEVERLWGLVIESFSFRLQELGLPTISQVGIPTYPKLKVLKVNNGFHLEELPACLEGLTQLERLEVVDVYPYDFLRKLTNFLLSLVKLKELRLDSLEALEKLPDQLGQLSSLKTLWCYNLKKMEEVPTTLGQLVQLEELTFVCCKSLKRLPKSLRNLTRLSKLNMRWCDALEVTDIDQQSLLQELEQRGCRITCTSMDYFRG